GTAGETSDITIVSSRFNNNSATSLDGIFTVAPNATPTFAGILPQTSAEDTPHSFTMTVSDLESTPCDLTLTFESSDETLVPASSVSYTCISTAYYVTFTPSSNQSGTVSLTITTTDIGSLSAYTIVELTIDSVNDPLTLSTIENQATDEDVPITVTFTVGDIETAPCGFDITLTSSNQSLFVDSNLTCDCQINSYTISMTPETNQSGMATITIVAADSDGLTALTAFDITVTAINDTPQIGTITDQLQYGSAIIEDLELSATDIETPTCNLGMSIMSSNPVLIPTSNIDYTCAANSLYFTLTPVSSQAGSSTITITVTDSGGLTASTSFILNINLPPELSDILHSGTAIGEISFTFVEADGDTVSLTVTSSDQSLISNAAITINGTNSNTMQLTTTAEIEQTISISLPQESNVHGLATITITASAIGGTVSETFNVIVSPPGSGNALTFDGDDDFISFGSIDGSHPLALAGSQFSLAFWIKPAIIGDSFQRIIDKSTAGLADDGYLLCLNTGNSLKFYLNGMARFTTDSDVVTADMWHHVVVTGDASQYKCYVNGIAVGLTTENSFELPPNATANLYMGTWYTESTREYRGQMDEVSIWNVALSETDVRNYMCSRLSGNETGLLAYFRFDNFTGTTLTDLSGNNFHGTLTNMENASWITSEVPLGDTSIYDYAGSVASDFSVTLSHSDGDAFTALGDSGLYSGIHIYLVNEAPSTYTSPAGFSTVYTDHYFGVYPVGLTPAYSVAYNYSGNTSITTDTGLRLAGRANNSSSWFDISASLNPSTTTLSQTGISAFSGVSTTEFIPGINNTPILGVISAQTINEDGIISSLAITVTDAETAPCSLNITFNSSDTVLVPVDNISYTCSANTYYLSITPLNNLTGVCDITITVTDAGGLSASGALALTVTDVNDVPLISTISDQTTIEDFAVGSISLTVADIEDAPCSMDITITSSDTVLIPNDNISYTCTSNTYWLTITPAADQNGLATITFTVIDSGALTAAYSFDFTITAVNDAPVLANPIANRIATEGTAYAYTVPSNTFTDVDSGDVLTYTATQENGSALPEWLNFDPSTRVFSGLPTNSDVGSITITITATDGSAQSITDTFVLSVNNTNTSPVLDNPIADQTTDEDVPYSFTFAADTFSDDDVTFGDTISYTAMLADGSPLPDWLTFDVDNRHFSGTPENDDVGMYTITVIAEDTLNLTAEDSFYLTVVNINDAPVISILSQDIALTIDEDTTIHSLPLTATDIETATCSLDITFVSSNTNLFSMDNISYTCNAETFYMSFIPALNQSGNAVISITVTDGSLSDATAFAFTVNSVNDTPLLTGDSTIVLDEDTSSSLSLSATDIETAGCSLNLTYVSSNTTLLPPENIAYTCSNGTINVDFTPVGDQSGNTNLTFTVSDPGALSASHVVLITVNDINDSPQIDVIFDQTIDEDTVLSAMKITVTDLETAGCSMGISFASSDTDLIPVANISYTCSANIFYLTLTPVAEQSGSSTITVTITDDGYLTAIESFVFNVNEVYDMPGTRGNPYTITCIEELYNMRDDNIGAYYCLIKDLDFNDAASYNNSNDTSYGDINGNSSVEGIQTELTTGTGWNADLFGGHLDGRFHVIKNLYINQASYAGLFQSTNHGTVIQNLGIVDADITKVAGYGGVVASEIHSTTIENVFVTGILRSTGVDPDGRNNGGIAGYAVDGTSYITDCYSDVLIESNVNENAGIVGFNGTTLTISNCLAKGNIPTGNGVGGIVGTQTGNLTIENSIAFMSQLSSGAVRRILANPSGGTSVLTNNYANSAMIVNASTVTSTDTSSIEGKDMSSAQLTDLSFYSTYLPSWDFDSVWELTGSGPKLKGFYSNALYFTGANDGASGTYINLGAATHFNGLSEMTCEAWVKPMSTKTWQEILHVQDNSGSTNAITFVLSNGHSLYGYINQTAFGCPHSVRIGQWNHLAYTWRASDGQIILYVNGEIVSSGTSSTSAVASGSGGNAYIGTLSGTSEFFDGSIDELRIWNSVRTQSEIRSSMHQECSGNETCLLACYHFNQASGTVLPDHGPYGINGTLINMNDNNWIASAGMSPIIKGTSQISQNSFYIRWQALSDSSNQFYIDIDDNSDFTSPLIKYMAIGSGAEYTISNLELNEQTHYYCRILTLGESGRSLYTEAQPFMLQPGKSLQFQSAQKEYVNIGNHNSLHLTSQITLEGWFKFHSLASDQGLVMKQYTVSDYHGFGLQYYVGGNPYFCFGLGDADSQENIYSVTIPVTNQWYHVAATYDGATIKMYVNGDLESTRSYTGGFDGSSNDYDLVLGKFSLADAYYFNGQMDEIRIWDIALDQAAIQANMSRELSGKESNLIAYYNFNNHTVNDMTLNNNDGTTYNMDETNYLISEGVFETNPVISFIADQTIAEDAQSHVISFTITDMETNASDLTLTAIISDSTKVDPSNMVFSGTDQNRILTITPTANANGTSGITIIVTDAYGLTATQSFNLTITAVNDIPEISTINSQNMSEGTSIDLTLTITDIEGDALSITVVSMDQSLIQDSDILLANDGSTYTISITPLVAQSGSTTLTISVSDGTDITIMTVMITVNEVYYTIAGHISNYTDIAGSHLEGVTMTLSGTHAYTLLTDATGCYTFSAVRPGNYTLTASKGETMNTLDLSDAIKILRAGARLTGLTCLEQIAADAYIDGYFGAYDAAKVAMYVSGIGNCLNDTCVFWQFVTENITHCETWPLIEFESARRYTDLTGDALGQDFIGIGCGNVAE
ncbi:MAG: tandem-95 repeat protein, partial [Candidatus Magnetomorum sp.]|nr:tandem-95 repeat protein [Candidatus Magnetomorum sp.]